MANTKPVGIAYADPEFVSVTVTGVTTAVGGVVGNVTGNVTGNITGNVTGNVTGNAAGTVTGNQTMPSATVAATGSTQSDAAAIALGFTLVSAADATKGIKLPAAAAGYICVIKNGANAVLKIWPNTDDAINAIAANGSLDIAALTSAYLVAYNATTWYSVPLLPS